MNEEKEEYEEVKNMMKKKEKKTTDECCTGTGIIRYLQRYNKQEDGTTDL